MPRSNQYAAVMKAIEKHVTCFDAQGTWNTPRLNFLFGALQIYFPSETEKERGNALQSASMKICWCILM